MPSDGPVYDLMLLLSTSADEDRRKQILSEVESAISAQGGSVVRNDDWGVRGMTFRIAHQADAEYHLLQFSGPPSLLDSLSHSLRIADDVLRFRIIKLIPGMPEAPSSPPPVVASVASAGSRAGTGSGAGAAAGTATAEREESGAGDSPAEDARVPEAPVPEAPVPEAPVPDQPAAEGRQGQVDEDGERARENESAPVEDPVAEDPGKPTNGDQGS